MSIENYKTAFTNPFYFQSIQNSIWISLMSSFFGILIACLGGYSISRLSPKLRSRFLMLSNMTSNFAGVPLAFAFMILLGSSGVLPILLHKIGFDLSKVFTLYSGTGLILVYIYFQIPLGILLMYPAFDTITEDCIHAATLLGASKIQFWTKIGIPLLYPSILGTFSILFANAMGAYATVYALTTGSYNVLPIRIGALVSGDMFLNPNMASALAVILGSILIGATLLNERLLKYKGGESHE
ncbi:ABC transporter permease [Geosporobacter ferrireducens]|nr:ABC transporter permease subunit [Geosporobacter ferrireducens]